MLTCVEFQNKSISWLLHGVELLNNDVFKVDWIFNFP